MSEPAFTLNNSSVPSRTEKGTAFPVLDRCNESLSTVDNAISWILHH